MARETVFVEDGVTIRVSRGKRTGLRAAFADVVLGIHSNIPLCCVTEFSVGTLFDLPVTPLFGGRLLWCRRRTHAISNYFFDHYGVQYKPCRLCRWLLTHGIRKPNVLHVCDDHCNGILNWYKKVSGL